MKYSISLDNVEVKASNIVHKNDKSIYSVTPIMKKGIYSAGQLLSRVNGIIYNPTTMEVSYLGSKNIVILIDSLEKDETYIKRQSPNRFDRIEVISFPTGKYLGYDALINFHSRPVYKGVESNLFTQAYAIPDNRLGRGKFMHRNDGYADFTYTHDNWNISAVLSDNWKQDAGAGGYMRTYIANGLTERTLNKNKKEPTWTSVSNNLNGNLAIDYQISPMQSVSLQWKYDHTDNHKNINQTLISTNEATNSTDTLAYRSAGHIHDMKRNNFGIYYRGRFNSLELNGTVNYTTSSWNSYSNIDRSSGYNLVDNRHTDMDYFWANAELSKFIGNRWGMSIIETLTLLNRKEHRLETNHILSRNRTIYNYLYAQAQYRPSKQVTLSAIGGFTAYRNSVGISTISKWMPRMAANFFWTPTQNAVLRLNYDLSNTMPAPTANTSYGQLTDSLTFQSGNPNLLPTSVHLINMNFTIMNLITLKVMYEHQHNAIFNIYSQSNIDNRPVVFNRYENGTYNSVDLGFNIYKELPFGFEVAADVYANMVKASYGDLRKNKWMPRGSFQLSYWNPKLFYVTFDYTIKRSLYATPQELTWGNYEISSIALQRTLLDNKLQVMFMYSIPIHFIKHNKIKSVLDSPALHGSDWSNVTYFRDNMISLSISYRINSGNQVRKYNRKTFTL
ncbi:MAG: outer membrane beta-barrel protein [Firmicutes bacterium]|nr:outer membrane beta-barrel protein [Bacillota bacterium]MCM1400680.1 outer membrane beta-barrel protein [Bacteroides sp.]MCM1476374.1 outer membrane beta-barrel protein [Bacteroides sp.]